MKKLIYMLLLVLTGTMAHAQVKIGANAKTIGSASNLEVEAANGSKTIIDKGTGAVTINAPTTIKDGTEGAGRVWTSDAGGTGTWQSLATQRIAEVVFIGEQSSADYTVTPSTFNAQKDRIPLVPRSGSLPGYDATTKEYTIQQDGYYRVYTGAVMIGTTGAVGTNVRLYLHPFGVLQQFNNIDQNNAPVLSLFGEAYMTAGTKVQPYGFVFGTTQNVIFKKTFMSVTKLF